MDSEKSESANEISLPPWLIRQLLHEIRNRAFSFCYENECHYCSRDYKAIEKFEKKDVPTQIRECFVYGIRKQFESGEIKITDDRVICPFYKKQIDYDYYAKEMSERGIKLGTEVTDESLDIDATDAFNVLNAGGCAHCGKEHPEKFC